MSLFHYLTLALYPTDKILIITFNHIFFINSLRIPNVDKWKYIEDTSTSEVVHIRETEHVRTIQNAVDEVQFGLRQTNYNLTPPKAKNCVFFNKFKNPASQVSVWSGYPRVNSRFKVTKIIQKSNEHHHFKKKQFVFIAGTNHGSP